MDENIPLSTEINSLNTEIIEDDDEISTIIDEINFDEILQSTNISENNFIKEITPSITDQFSVPSFDKVLGIYLKNFTKNIVPKKCNYKLITVILRLVQFLAFLTILFGSILPFKLLKFHIILCIKVLVLWEYLDNKCYISMAIQKLSSLNECPEFILLDPTFSKQFILLVMFISIIGIIIPDISLYKIFYKIINSLKKYD